MLCLFDTLTERLSHKAFSGSPLVGLSSHPSPELSVERCLLREVGRIIAFTYRVGSGSFSLQVELLDSTQERSWGAIYEALSLFLSSSCFPLKFLGCPQHGHVFLFILWLSGLSVAPTSKSSD